MRKIILFLVFMLFTSLNAAGYEKNIKYRAFKVGIESKKPLTEGLNEVFFKIYKNSNPIDAKEVKIKFFMPAMPGMPYMESKAKAKKVAKGIYKAKANLTMRGTWQVHIYITDKNGKKYRIKTSVNF